MSSGLLRALFIANIIWLLTVASLGIWWGSYILKQADQLALIEKKMGVPENIQLRSQQATERMVYWESLSFVLLICLSGGVLLWFYWRESRRAKSLEAFFMGVSHELRTPLTSIRLQAESLAEEHPNNPLTERLLEDTSRLEHQVNRVLDFTRLKGGGAVELERVSLRRSIGRFIQKCEAAYGEKIQFDLSIENYVVHCNEMGLEVVLKNLVENTLRHSGREVSTISIWSENKDGQIEVFFQDNGQGFRGNRKRLGRLFEKGAASTGTGIGLYLVKALMKKMGGRVSFPDVKKGFGVVLELKGHHG